jgi:hypothetical protein
MSTKIKIRHQGVALEISKETDTRFVIPDYTTGKRVRHVRTTETEARDLAKKICEAMAGGNKDLLGLSPFESEIRAAMNALPMGVRLGRAADIIADCCRIVEPGEIVTACRYWKDQRPDKKFAPRSTYEAVEEYMDHQKHLSERRQRALDSYFNSFTNKFGKKCLHEITTADLKDFVFGRQSWKSAKTRNEVRAAIGLLYKDAQERGYVARGYNPSAELDRERLKNGDVGVFMPDQVRQIMNSLEDELALPMALWFFGGLRKENLARIQFSSLRSALKTGFLKIAAHEDLKTGARTVRLEPNLRAWIEWYLARHPDASGPVLAVQYSEGRRLDNLTRKITCRSGVTWTRNAPRHSCLTMWLSRPENVQNVAKWAGNSLAQIQRHYWNKSDEITPHVSEEYFSIRPSGQAENVVRLPAPDVAAETGAAALTAGLFASSIG